MSARAESYNGSTRSAFFPRILIGVHIPFACAPPAPFALAVWGAYMVKTGILRTFGEALRSWLATRLSNRFAGFAAGMGLAMLLQSSTAASLLVASLQAGGLVSTAAALAAVLGADLGSALAARILTLNISSLIPILLIAGTFLFLRRMEKREGQFGRMLLGLPSFFWRCKHHGLNRADARQSDHSGNLGASSGASLSGGGCRHRLRRPVFLQPSRCRPSGWRRCH